MRHIFCLLIGCTVSATFSTIKRSVIFCTFVEHNSNGDLIRILKAQQTSFIAVHINQSNVPARALFTSDPQLLDLSKNLIFKSVMFIRTPTVYRHVDPSVKKLLVFELYNIFTYDICVLIDADVLFIHPYTRWIPEDMAKNILYVKGEGSLHRSFWGSKLFEQFNATLPLLYHDFSEPSTQAFNAGILLFRPSCFFRSVLASAFSMYLLHSKDSLAEQGIINFIMNSGGKSKNIDVRTLTTHVSNCLQSDCSTLGAYSLAHFCGGVGNFGWKANAMDACVQQLF